MRLIVIISILIFALYSCHSNESRVENEILSKKTITEIDILVHKIDSLQKANHLTKIDYPNMSFCAGALEGLFLEKELIKIEAHYDGEIGFSEQTNYWSNNELYLLKFRNVRPDINEFEKNFGNTDLDFMRDNMTFFDTSFTVYLTDPIAMFTYHNDTIVSESIDIDLIELLIDCAESSRLELLSIEH